MSDVEPGIPVVRTYALGQTAHYLNGELHRADGPAMSERRGANRWYWMGRKHRTDGPAVTYVDGRTEFWVHGHRLAPHEENVLRTTATNIVRTVLELYSPGDDIDELLEAANTAHGSD
jgi:hypothetical protein